MFLAEAACLVLGFILYISGVQGQESSICALKDSSVNLTCSAERPTSDMKWFAGYSVYSRIESTADGSHGKYSISEENNFTLTINNLTNSDERYYCCGKTTERSDNCKNSRIALSVADLQVKVIPSTEGQTVTLMCSTSCPLTENPAAYIWYKNGEFVYEDWSPWYQELVSSEEAVRYSCAVKGYEDLRAPQVSVDSVTATCFSVTYAKGRMCSYKQTSLNEPCSITYPRGIRVQMSPADAADHLRLTCSTSCPLTAPLTSFTWYKNRIIEGRHVDQQFVVTSTDAANAGFSCVIKGFEDLHSADVCAEDNNCWSLNCFNRRICALEGSSVNISNELSHPGTKPLKSKLWYRGNMNSKQGQLDRRFMEYDDMKKQNILRLKNLKRSDSGEYTLSIWITNSDLKLCDTTGVSLMVTGLTVTMTPSAEVTEGQRVTLTCSTSCPLTDNTNYMWYFNGRPLSQSKHLLLDPVSVQHAGSYSCAVNTHEHITSAAETLTVQSIRRLWEAVAGGVGAALLVLIILAVVLWIRRKRTSKESSTNETLDNMEMYSEIPAQPAEQELHYSRVYFSENHHGDPLYSTVQTHLPQEHEHTPYAVVNIRSNTTKHTDQAEDN